MWENLKANSIDGVRGCLRQGYSVEDRNMGWTPLMHASERNQMVMMDVLIKHRADLNATNGKKMRTAFSFAASPSNGHDEAINAVALLLGVRANIHHRDASGRTAEQRASDEGHLASSTMLRNFRLSGR